MSFPPERKKIVLDECHQAYEFRIRIYTGFKANIWHRCLCVFWICSRHESSHNDLQINACLCMTLFHHINIHVLYLYEKYHVSGSRRHSHFFFCVSVSPIRLKLSRPNTNKQTHTHTTHLSFVICAPFFD